MADRSSNQSLVCIRREKMGDLMTMQELSDFCSMDREAMKSHITQLVDYPQLSLVGEDHGGKKVGYSLAPVVPCKAVTRFPVVHHPHRQLSLAVKKLSATVEKTLAMGVINLDNCPVTNAVDDQQMFRVVNWLEGLLEDEEEDNKRFQVVKGFEGEEERDHKLSQKHDDGSSTRNQVQHEVDGLNRERYEEARDLLKMIHQRRYGGLNVDSDGLRPLVDGLVCWMCS